MLTDAQLYHFAVHGWVLQEDVFNSEEIDAFKCGLDHLYERKVSTMKGLRGHQEHQQYGEL